VEYLKFPLFAACIIVVVSSIAYPVRAADVPLPAPIDAAPIGTAPINTPPIGTASGPTLRAQTQAANTGPSPITLRLQYTGEAGENAIGGIHNGAVYMNQILGQLHVDTDKAFGWTGGSFVLEGFYENAESAARYVGAAQDPSLIDTSGVAMFRVYQAYYKQDLGNTNLLFGIYDTETEFGITRPMDVFFNGGYAWTATLDKSGLNGPSTYPNTPLAIRIRQKITDQWSVQAAVLDGVPDSPKYPNINAVNINRDNGALLLAEVDYTPTKTTKILAGYWHYTGKFDALNETDADGTQRRVYGSSGGYVGGATRLYSQTARRGLDGFVNVGLAGGKTNEVDGSLNFGLTYTGLLDDRPFDRMGVAASIVRAGGAFKEMQIAAGNRVHNYETNFELTYRAPINRWLTIQPDIQYWIHPGLDPMLKDDLLFLVHFEISHVFDF
jgi:porin